jgi:hypothetical protein
MHVHRWYFNKDAGMYKCKHPKCRAGLGLFVVADRLNEYETLKKENEAWFELCRHFIGGEDKAILELRNAYLTGGDDG